MAQEAKIESDWSALSERTANQIAALATSERSLRVPLTLLERIDALETLLSIIYSHSLQVGFPVSPFRLEAGSAVPASVGGVGPREDAGPLHRGASGGRAREGRSGSGRSDASEDPREASREGGEEGREGGAEGREARELRERYHAASRRRRAAEPRSRHDGTSRNSAARAAEPPRGAAGRAEVGRRAPQAEAPEGTSFPRGCR